MRLFTALLIGGVLALSSAPVAAQTRSPSELVVIVHADNPVTALEKKSVSDAFLRKNRYWKSGAAILPVDLPVTSPMRERFCTDILGRSVSAIQSYFQQLIFSGRDVPPPERSSEEAVVAYVRDNPGAIGYVSGKTELTGVKAIRVE